MKSAFTGMLAAALFVATAPTKATDLQDAIAADYEYLGKLFTHFHANPELSFQEIETSKRLANELAALGYNVTTGVGKTGVVAVMENGEGPTVLIRADMDGLPVKEKTGLPYASTATQILKGKTMPVMHACGHDMHMTSLVGTAMRLAASKDKWQGTLVLVGQPAEEIIAGAEAMLKDGLYERFPTPDYALGLHVFSTAEAGKIIYREGTMLSSSDSVQITIPGIGTHGAAPHMGKDPVVIGSQIVTALQTLVAREISPLDPGVVTVGTFHAGTKNNIISDEAVLGLTVRSNSNDVREALLSGIKRIAINTAKAAGMPDDKLPVIKHIVGTNVTQNDAALTARLDKTLKAKFGEDRILPYKQTNMGAEDFSYFTETDEKVPGFFFIVGGTLKATFEAEANGGPAVAGHHSPLFKIAPEASIKTGVEAMTIAALELLQK